CGWQTRRPAPPGNWYELVAAGLAPHAERVAFDAAPLIGEDGWAGEGLRPSSPQTGAPELARPAPAAPPESAEAPRPARRPPPPGPAPPKPLAPSRPGLAEPAARSPLGAVAGAAAREGSGFRRGLLVHRLLQILPELLPEARRAA